MFAPRWCCAVTTGGKGAAWSNVAFPRPFWRVRPGLDFGGTAEEQRKTAEALAQPRNYGTRRRPLQRRFTADSLRNKPELPEALRLAAEALLREV